MLSAIHRQLGIPDDYASRSRLPEFAEPSALVFIGFDVHGRLQRLEPQAAEHWRLLHQAVYVDGIVLKIVSAFRSVDDQVRIFRKKLDRGLLVSEILRSNAAPGHSGHHTGRALDLTTQGVPLLTEQFDTTDAFAWLQRNGHRF